MSSYDAYLERLGQTDEPEETPEDREAWWKARRAARNLNFLLNPEVSEREKLNWMNGAA